MYTAKDIGFNNIALNKDKGWFHNIGYNAVFEIDLATGKLRPEAFMPEEKWGIRELFGAIAYYDDKLYLAPRNTDRLCIYDLKKQEPVFIDLDMERYGDNKKSHLISQVEVIGKHVYFFPGRFQAIVKLNPTDFSLEYIDSWHGELSANWGEDKENEEIFNRCHVRDGGWCILPCWKANVILKINVLCGEYSIIESGIDGELSDAVEMEDKYIGAFKGSKSLYEISNKGTIELPLELEKDEGCYLCKYGSNVCIIPWMGTRMDIYDLHTYEKKMSYKFPDTVSDSQRWIKDKNTSLCNEQIDGHRLVLYGSRSGEILFVDMAECSVRSIAPTMDDETEKSIEERVSELFVKTAFRERMDYRLNDFLETLNTLS